MSTSIATRLKNQSQTSKSKSGNDENVAPKLAVKKAIQSKIIHAPTSRTILGEITNVPNEIHPLSKKHQTLATVEVQSENECDLIEQPKLSQSFNASSFESHSGLSNVSAILASESGGLSSFNSAEQLKEIQALYDEYNESIDTLEEIELPKLVKIKPMSDLSSILRMGPSISINLPCEENTLMSCTKPKYESNGSLNNILKSELKNMEISPFPAPDITISEVKSEDNDLYLEENEDEKIDKSEKEGLEYQENGSSTSPMSIETEAEKPIDIDQYDVGDPKMMTDYISSIYERFRETEVIFKLNPNYLEVQKTMTVQMRRQLVEWMFEMHLKFRLLSESLFLAVNVLDRFLSTVPVASSKFQLVAATSILIASKYEEIYSPEVQDMVFVSDHAFTKEDVIKMELFMLNSLSWQLAAPTALQFLRRFSKAARCDTRSHTLAKYLIEAALPEYNFTKYLPSTLAAAATYLSRRMLRDPPFWDATLVHYTNYEEQDLIECATEFNELLTRISTQPELQNRPIVVKYNNTKNLEVSKIPPITM